MSLGPWYKVYAILRNVFMVSNSKRTTNKVLQRNEREMLMYSYIQNCLSVSLETAIIGIPGYT